MRFSKVYILDKDRSVTKIYKTFVLLILNVSKRVSIKHLQSVFCEAAGFETSEILKWSEHIQY